MKLYRRSTIANGGRILLFALLLGVTAIGCSRSTTGGNGHLGGGGYSPPQTWASQPGADLLWSVHQTNAAIAKDDAIVLVDCRYAVAEFDSGHLPTAIWLDWHEISNDPPVDFPAVGDVENFLGQERGIKVDSTIVLYGDGLSEMEAPFRLFWMLEYYGCRDVHIMNGGVVAWVDAGYTLDNAPWDPASIVPETFTANIDNLNMADATDVQVFLTNPATAPSVLIDVRSPGEFNGEYASEYQDRAGRIPQAGFFNWLDTIDPLTGLLVDVNLVIDQFDDAGFDPVKEIIAYSTTSVRSTTVYFLSRVLGYNCRVYHGGMVNWSDVDSPPLASLGLVERSGPFFHRSIIAGDRRPHYGGAAAALDGQAFVIGGLFWDEVTQGLLLSRSIFRFDPTASPLHEGSDDTCWTRLDLHTGIPIYAHCAVAVPDASAIYIFGGIDPAGTVYNLILRVDIDPVTYNTTSVTKLPETFPKPLAFGKAVYNDADGLIYIFGGQNDLSIETATDSVFAYLPGAPPYEVASLPAARTRHGAAVVDGKVYCLGGELSDGTILADFLEYDPLADTWTALTPMSIPRLRADGAMAFGRVHICGGYSYDPVDGYLTSDLCESIEPTDPASGWREEGRLAVGRYCNPVASVNNRIYLFGGYSGAISPLDNEIEFINVTEFKPADQAQKAAMPAPQYRGATAEINDKIYLIAGSSGKVLTDRVLEYDPATDAYVDMDPFPGGPAREMCAAAINGQALVFGGTDGNTPSQSAFAFDPAQSPGDQWSQLADLPVPISGAAACHYSDVNNNLGYGADHDLVFVIGGTEMYGWTSDQTYIYDAMTNTWDFATFLLPSARTNAAATICMDDIFLTGGADGNGNPLADTLMLVLDSTAPGFLTWTPLGAMPTARYGHGAVMVDGCLHAIGGFIKNKSAFAGCGAVEVFDPLKGRWTVLQSLDTGRAFPFVSAAPSASGNSLFVMGGYSGKAAGIYYSDTIELAP